MQKIKMTHAGGYLQYHVFFVKFNWFPVVQCVLERKTACWDLTGSSVIKLHPKIIAFCMTRYWTKDVLTKVPDPRILYTDM